MRKIIKAPLLPLLPLLLPATRDSAKGTSAGSRKRRKLHQRPATTPFADASMYANFDKPKSIQSLNDLTKPGAALQEFDRIVERIERADTEHEQVLMEELAGFLDLTAVYERDENAWLEFCRHSYWAEQSPQCRPKPNETDDVLRFLVHRACAHLSDPKRRSNRVHFYYSALRELQALGVRTTNRAKQALEGKNLTGFSKDWAKRNKELRGVLTATPPSTLEVKRDKPKSSREEKTTTTEDQKIISVDMIENKTFSMLSKLNIGEEMNVKIRRVSSNSARMLLRISRITDAQ